MHNFSGYFAIVALLLVGLLLAVGCGGADEEEAPLWEFSEPPVEEIEPTPQECADGEVFNPITEECNPLSCTLVDVRGRTCRPDGGDLGAVQAELTGQSCNGPYSAAITTDDEGYFEFSDVPHGSYELRLKAGLFERVIAVEVDEGGDVFVDAVDEELCFVGDEVKIAVFEDAFDDVGSQLDEMGLDYDTFPLFAVGSNNNVGLDTLADIDELLRYDVVLFECGQQWIQRIRDPTAAPTATIFSNLQDFVAAGNHLVVTDMAYELGAIPFPDMMTMYGAADSSSLPSVGGSQAVSADVVSAALLEHLGTSTLEINYALGSWVVAVDAGPSSVVHLRSDVDINTGSVDDAPLLITYEDSSGGTVTYKSFHNDATDDGESKAVMDFMLFHQ